MIRREMLPEDPDQPGEAADDGGATSSPAPGCWNCRFWRRAGRDGPGPDWGQCKRMPPVLPEIEDEKMVHVGLWPSTEAADWCGEWQRQDRGSGG
jgi:hypothetical protein